jgi:hypothetical protein
MRTHYHLVVEVETGVLPSAMHALNFRYACQYNVRNGMRGHVFGARYDSPRIRDSEDLLRVYRYVMRNPVEAGLCARPEDWPWSSYAGSVGLGQVDTFVNASAVLELMDADVVEVAQERLRTYVDLRDEDVTGPGPGRVPPGLANERDISYVSY